jgi:hypothetical protein
MPKAEEAEINAHLLMEAGIRAQIIENQVRRKKLLPQPRRRQFNKRMFEDDSYDIDNVSDEDASYDRQFQ